MTGAHASLPVGEWESRSPVETFELGQRFGKNLAGGEIILLSGTLGAGKTLFVKGIASALDFDTDEVTSPSFTLVNLYKGRLTLYHLDLYRLPEGATAAHAVDLDDLLADERAVIVIEWAERLGNYRLPPPVWHIEIAGDGDDARLIKSTRKGEGDRV
ncbi:MAG: tRNA (adenosine(37)-N6)-threonylcarbamoyltransferase complex ATPase subunit type 1 TsaE [Pyrinomonadaceae bacterium]|nr:tRNA (adenosine(37)-N6)-threonylcarbamoyltransferase complex ATPase subunit type 1 TsaE [Pyrinomonadaceae bacterium]